jgi:hypothetical protein
VLGVAATLVVASRGTAADDGTAKDGAPSGGASSNNKGPAAAPTSAAKPVSIPPALAGKFASDVRPLVTKYCGDCHSGAAAEAAVDFDRLNVDAAAVLAGRDTWEKAVDNLDQHVMPPDGNSKPSPDERARIVAGLRALFDHADSLLPPDPGRVTLRRLNRTEYANTIRDLMFVDFDAAADFPSDDVGHGFDNIGDVLTLSPVLMERYVAAAETILARAIIAEAPKSPKRYQGGQYLRPSMPDRDRRKGFRRIATDGKAPFQSGPIYNDFRPIAGDEYVFSARVYGEAKGDKPIKIAMLIGGRSYDKEFPPSELATLTGTGLEREWSRGNVLKTLDVTARESKKAQNIEFRFTAPANVDRLGLAIVKPQNDDDEVGLHVEHLALEGPLDTRPQSQRKLLATSPDLPPATRSREVLSKFLLRAYRRPPTSAEIDRVVAIADDAERDGRTWELAVARAMLPVLASPKFLFRSEPDPQPEAAGPHPIDEYALASRLSYFLWSTMPDDELLRLAGEGRLSKDLAPQVRRMLADPRSATLVDNFALQWLQLKRLSQFSPDPKMFPSFNEKLRSAMLEETRLAVAEVIREDKSVLELLSTDHTYVNEYLAKLYGLADTAGNRYGDKQKKSGGQQIRGPQFVRVELKDGTRGGLLTQASILAVTSNPTRTSPVKRGRWVLEQLLGAPPPPPPPNVPELKEGGEKLTGTLRQQMEQHRENPSCASCHARMDPLGFALENYDAIGAYRTKDGEHAVDPSGTLVDGTAVSGPVDLKNVLLAKKDTFTRCLAEKMLIYALGRGLERTDRRTLDAITSATGREGYKFSALVTAIVTSDPFRLRRGKGQE